MNEIELQAKKYYGTTKSTIFYFMIIVSVYNYS